MEEEKQSDLLTHGLRIQALYEYGIRKPLTLFNHLNRIQPNSTSFRTVQRKVKELDDNEIIQIRQKRVATNQMIDEINDNLEDSYVNSIPQLKKDLNLQIFDMYFWRILKEQGYSYQSAIKKPILTHGHIQSRLRFASRYLNCDFSATLFVDEVSFCTHTHPKKVWAKNGSQVIVHQPKFPFKLHGWAGISKYGFTPLYLFEENLNSDKYVKILKENLEFIQNFLFQGDQRNMIQDNDPKHKSKIVTKYFQENEVSIIEDYPSNSPDLNPIEHVWAQIKLQLKEYNTQTKQDLEDSLLEI